MHDVTRIMSIFKLSCGRKMSNGYWMHHCDLLFAILNSIRVIFGKNGQCARRGMFVY